MASPNIIAIPFRRGAHLSLAAAIRQYISARYDQHPDMFRADLDVVDALRRDAVNVREPHPSGVKKLQAYAAQLVWMGGKFPIDIGADFTWYPALGYNTDRPIIRNNLKYELLNTLFNLAALHTQLATTSSTTTDGVKTAANHLRLAAGVLQHMASEVLPLLRSDPPEDMDAHTLASLAQLCLAQAQECYWQRAVMDEYKDGLIAKLAASVSDLYDAAGEEAVCSEAVSSGWIHHMSAKQHHFAAAAQYRTARDCLERRRYGEEVARLRDALSCVVGGLQEAKKGCLNKSVADDLNGLRRKLEEDLKRAEKDNDMIYLNPVPPKSELKRIERANMAIPQTPPQITKPLDHLGEKAEFGPPLFTRLVPFSVHQATTIYEERRDRLASQTIIQTLEALTETLHDSLTSLGLPGSLQALEKPLGLPHSLSQHADELRQAEALGRISKGIADIEKLRAADREVYDEGLEVLAAEEEEDGRLRAKYGTDRWARARSAEDEQGARLREQAAEIEGYFATSANSDALVREKFTDARETLALLAGPERGLMAYVPSSTQASVPENLKSAIGRLRGAYNDVLRLESRRRRRVEALREKCQSDDIRPDILREAARLERSYPDTTIVPMHFEEFFEKRLDKLYEADLEALEKEKHEQERLLGEVSRVNREFDAQKRVRDKDTRVREERLQALEEGYLKYKEIVNNLEVGRKFYNDLSRIVGQIFRDQARGWANQRRMEARALEEELSLPPLSALNISRPLHSPPQEPTYQQAFHPPPQQVQEPEPEPEQEAPYQSWADETVAPAQPRPVAPGQGMWTPDAGIRFAPREGKGTWEPGAGIKFS